MLRLAAVVGRSFVTKHGNLQFASSSHGVGGNPGQNKMDSTDLGSCDKKNQGLTPENPFFVASPSSKCIVGCSCSDESHSINWFYVTEGAPQTCTCGYFFKLVKVDPMTDYVPEYSRVMYVDDKKTDDRLRKKEPFFRRLIPKRHGSPIAPASMDKKTEGNKPSKT